MALEWSMVYAGMMIALPASEWAVFRGMSGKELAGYLREWASKINLERIKKHGQRARLGKLRGLARGAAPFYDLGSGSHAACVGPFPV
jgi:hypothetical protein